MQLSLFGRPVPDAAYRTPQAAQTPPALLERGWVAMESVHGGLVAYRRLAEGGTLRMSIEAAERVEGVQG